jgi:hypothetical protein
MNQFDSRQAPGAEPAEGTNPVTENLPGEDAETPPACWEGYSPDTLAVLDELPPGTW